VFTDSGIVQIVLQVVMRLIRQGVDATLRNPMTAYHDRVRLLNYGWVTEGLLM
jgi:hypothetical protein